MKAMKRLWTEKAGANSQGTVGSPEGLLSTVGNSLEELIGLGLQKGSSQHRPGRGPALLSTHLSSLYFVSSEHLLSSGMRGSGDTGPVLHIKAKHG